MKKYYIFFIIFIAIFYIPFVRADQNQKDKIQVNSDKLTLNQDDLSATFSGSVVILFEDGALKTNIIKVYYKKEEDNHKIDKIIFPEKFTITKDSGKEIIIADSGEYLNNKNKLILNGNVILYKDGNIIITEQAVYFTKLKNINHKNGS